MPAQPPNMSDAEMAHWKAVCADPLYWETRMWHPVLTTMAGNRAPRGGGPLDWLDERGLQRGDAHSRNDYLHPLTNLYIFADPEHAVEFALRWSGEPPVEASL